MRVRRWRCRASSRLRSPRSRSTCGRRRTAGHGGAGQGRASRAGPGASRSVPLRPSLRPAAPTRCGSGSLPPAASMAEPPAGLAAAACVAMATAAGNTPRLLPGGSGRGCSDAEGAGGPEGARPVPAEPPSLSPGWAEVLAAAAGALQAGGLVAVPTDTVYGVACLAQDPRAVRSIYGLKGRNGRKPLAICLGDVEHIYRYCHVNVPDELLRDLLPGPVTLVLKRSEELNKDLNPFTSVGLYHGMHLRVFGGQHAVFMVLHVSFLQEFQDLWPQLSLVIDGGPVGDVQSPECRLGSTVVDLSVSGKYTIIRPGCALQSTVEILRQKYGLVPESS
uniref:Threonylcarbamoyl-AMP synthase n=1 Tax=Anas zonorhyncha TaxID=75864 RepID=A0A8B9VMA6_9AVES